MKAILNDNVPKLGYKGDVVEVKDGYFRNFLFPKKLAIVATKDRIALSAKRREKVVLEKGRLLDNVKEAMEKLKGLKIEIPVKVTDKGTMYASLSEQEVVDAIRAVSNMLLEKKYIKFDEPIKTLGEHTVTVDFGKNNTINVGVNLLEG